MENMEKIPSVPLTWRAGAGHPLLKGEGFSRMHFPIWTGQEIAQPLDASSILLPLINVELPMDPPWVQLENAGPFRSDVNSRVAGGAENRSCGHCRPKAGRQ